MENSYSIGDGVRYIEPHFGVSLVRYEIVAVIPPGKDTGEGAVNDSKKNMYRCRAEGGTEFVFNEDEIARI